MFLSILGYNSLPPRCLKGICFIQFFLILSIFSLYGQSDTVSHDTLKSISSNDGSFALFGSSELLNVTLVTDITSYARKNLNGSSLDGELTFHFKNDSLSRKVKIKARGVSRYDNCGFPPMEINFKKPLEAYNDTSTFRKIKFVTHCENGSANDIYVLREFLVYKMFNIISDTSYRVRLVRIRYIDSFNKRKPITQYGYFIEPAAILAGRTNTVINKTKGLTQGHMLQQTLDKVSIFNYLIANWDWNIPNQQNVSILKSPYSGSFQNGIVVPYDFDLSGLVNADYAIIPPELGISSKRERLFLGICRSRNIFNDDLQFFVNRKEEIYRAINDFQYLNLRAKKDIISFLNQFYLQIENRKGREIMIDNFLSACKHL